MWINVYTATIPLIFWIFSIPSARFEQYAKESVEIFNPENANLYVSSFFYSPYKKRTAVRQEVNATGCYYNKYLKLRSEFIRAGIIQNVNLSEAGLFFITSWNLSKKLQKKFFYIETVVIEKDQQIALLKNNSNSEDHNLCDIWKNTYQVRQESFVENKTLKRLNYYMSFQCLKSDDGGFMVGLWYFF